MQTNLFKPVTLKDTTPGSVREAYELWKVLELSAVEAAMQNLPSDLISDWIGQFETARNTALV